MTTDVDIHLARVVERGPHAGGRIEFEERPPRTPRGRGSRAYYWTPVDGERRELKSVTTILGDVVPKFALQAWYEEMGAAGAAQLAAEGRLNGVDPDRAIDLVRAEGLGAAARSKGAMGRGLAVHALLENYALTGDAPNPNDHPEEVRGYVRGLVDWLLVADPEPIAVERLTCEPDLGYAGRMDLRARVRGRDVVVDLKTNRRGAVYLEAHIQAVGYALGEIACGDGPPDGCMVVAVGREGTFEESDVICEASVWDDLMGWHRTLGGLKSAFADAKATRP
jgi:hypothetical protein